MHMSLRLSAFLLSAVRLMAQVFICIVIAEVSRKEYILHGSVHLVIKYKEGGDQEQRRESFRGLDMTHHRE